jgi:hypothetical protein
MLLIASIDVSRHILVLDTSVFLKDNMDRRKYKNYEDICRIDVMSK